MSKSEPPVNTETENAAVRKPNYLSHVAKGAMINFSGGVIRMILVYAYTLLLTRVLSVYELGQFFLMVTILNILGIAAAAGLDIGTVRYVALFVGEGRFRQVRKVIQVGLITGVLIAIVAGSILFSAAGILSEKLFEQSDMAAAGLRILALAIPFWVAARLFNATTQGFHRMRYQVYSRDIAEQVSRIALTAAAAMLGAGLIGVIWANVASLVLAAAVSLIFMMTVLPKPEKTISETAGTTSRLLRYSYPLAFSNVLMVVVVWTDLLLVGFLGNATDAGYYGVALKVATASAAILIAFSTVFNPIISDIYNRHQRTELQFLYKTVTRWIFACSFPVFLVLMLFSGTIMRFFGAEYADSGMALTLLAFSHLITATVGTAGLVVLMTGRSRLELVNMVAALAVDVLLCLLLIPEYGIIGGAIANIAAAGVLNLMRALEIWVLLRMHAYSIGFLKPLMAGLVSAAAVVLAGRFVVGYTTPAQVAGLVAAMLMLYLLIMMLLGLNEQDRNVLRLVKMRLERVYQG